MKIELHKLLEYHAKLRGHPIDYGKSGSLALQRAKHRSPVDAAVMRGGNTSEASISWAKATMAVLTATDDIRTTEDGAEAVALGYVHRAEGWTVKRRARRGEYADWILGKDKEWCALEISGVAEGSATQRLREKVAQVKRCTLPAERLAVVVQFGTPQILAENI
jgi:hypothetical protein